MKQLVDFIPRFSRHQMMLLLTGALAGVLVFFVVRFVFQPSDTVHYHANFAVFINGKRQEFKGSQFYQEVAGCSAKSNPQGRVHMHDQVSHVVHIHDNLVTWANFFSIIGWSFHERALFDGKTSYTDGHNGALRFILNGKPALSVANEVIKNEDVLLVDFSSDQADALTERYNQIEKDARQFNERKDPAACTGPEEQTLSERVRRAIWF